MVAYAYVKNSYFVNPSGPVATGNPAAARSIFGYGVSKGDTKKYRFRFTVRVNVASTCTSKSVFSEQATVIDATTPHFDATLTTGSFTLAAAFYYIEAIGYAAQETTPGNYGPEQIITSSFILKGTPTATKSGVYAVGIEGIPVWRKKIPVGIAQAFGATKFSTRLIDTDATNKYKFTIDMASFRSDDNNFPGSVDFSTNGLAVRTMKGGDAPIVAATGNTTWTPQAADIGAHILQLSCWIDYLTHSSAICAGQSFLVSQAFGTYHVVAAASSSSSLSSSSSGGLPSSSSGGLPSSSSGGLPSSSSGGLPSSSSGGLPSSSSGGLPSSSSGGLPSSSSGGLPSSSSGGLPSSSSSSYPTDDPGFEVIAPTDSDIYQW